MFLGLKVSNQKNKWHRAAQFNQCTSFCSEALRNEKVQLQKTLDKVAAIAIHSKAAQCVFTLNRAGENLVWFVDPLLGASIPIDIKYLQYAHPSCPFWYSFKAVCKSKGEKSLIQKSVFNPIVLGWKFRPSHCWQQGWVQKNSCLLSWASSKYVREGERNEIKYSESAGSVGFVGGEQSGPWRGLWCPPCVTRPPPPWWRLRQPPRAPWTRRRRRGRWWTTRGPREEKTSCWIRTGELRFLITSRVLSSLSLSSLWDSLWRFYAL